MLPYDFPQINSNDEVEKSWAKWLKEKKDLYHGGYMKPEEKLHFENLALEFKIDLRTHGEIFKDECNNFRNFMKTKQTC